MLDLAVPRLAPRATFMPALPPTAASGPTLCIDALTVRGRCLDFTLEPGEIALVEGGSRAERLRVLGIAAGLSHAGPGRCWLKGVDSRAGTTEDRRWLRQRSVGRLLSVDTLPDGVSLRGAVAMPLLAMGGLPHAAFDRATALLETLDLSAMAGSRHERLTRRERRLALLARALVASPPLLVLEDLDEALAPADLPRVRAALRLATAVEGCAILFSCDEPRLASLAGQRVNMD
jgi:putative ABC transport system ATP-binding protein